MVEGLSWIVTHHQAGDPAVVNLSVGGPASEALDTAVRALVEDGVTVVAAAGNDSQDACTTSPARVDEVITVGASTQTDTAADFSNYGSCLDLYAPGEGILSAFHTSDTVGAYASGTSMAAPHVAGVAARILESAPRSTPEDVAAAVSGSVTTVDFAPAGSPDALLYAADDTDPPPAEEPEVLLPTDGERLAGADRYGTSAAVSAASYARPAPVVYVASGTAFADSLSGAPVAARAGAPLLLVRPDSVPAPVASELRSLRPGRVVVLGGTGVVSSRTASELGRITGASVSRLAGADRYATAARISAASYRPDVPAVYVANGTAFADALSGAPVAGMHEVPVLLVTRDTIPAAVAQELRRLSPGRVVVLGGTGVVSERVADQLDRYAG